MATEKITKKQLVELFLNPEVSGLNGASFIGIDTVTNVKLKGGKKNDMQGRITKVVTMSSVMIFSNKNSNGYSNMVKRRLEQEGKDFESFEVKPRVWGQRIENTPLVLHKDEYYLEVIFLKSGKVEYKLDGQPIEKNNIVGLSEKREGTQGGLNNKVIIRTYKVSSITGIRINNKDFIVE